MSARTTAAVLRLSFAAAAVLAVDGTFAAEVGEAALVNWVDWVKVMLSLIGVIVLILFLARGLRQWGSQARKSPAVFNVLAAISLGNKEKIYLVKVGEEQLVVGSSHGGLTMLHVMQHNVSIEEIEQARANAAAPAKFADVLKQMGRGWHQ
jgi:flagellar protein FliO/FliZ